MKKIVFCLFILCIAHYSFAQQRIAAFEMNEKLGRGINMGNAFEAPSETAWGNPWQPEYFRIISEMGFQHVRLPIQWETADRSLSAVPYTIEESFLERIKEVVDHALEHDLIIIINMHHHELLFDDPEGQKERFLSQWSQIAEYFKDYPEGLLFEVLNEPHGNLTPQLWNVFFADALEVIRETNPNRMVIMGTADYGGLSGLPYVELPDDENIILSVHYYSPFTFTHQGAEWVGPQADEWLGTEWKDTEEERASVISEFAPALAFSEAHQIPIHVGEFGAYSKADLESRVRWTTFLARWFEEQNLSWAYWEFSAGFGIYNPSDGQVLQALLDALLNNEMPDPVATQAVAIYKSDFSAGADGWTLQVQDGLEASMDVTAGTLQVAIERGGEESWHVQIAKNNLPLIQDKMYRITVTASSVTFRNVTLYAGKASSPWNAYSGYTSLGLSPIVTSFSNTFTMKDPTDMESRMVFDLGNSNENVEILEVNLEEIRIGENTEGEEEEEEEEEEDDPVTSINKEEDPVLRYYPNPVRSILNLSNVKKYKKALLYDLNGRMVANFELHGNEMVLNVEQLPSGQYLLRLHGNQKASYHLILLKQ